MDYEDLLDAQYELEQRATTNGYDRFLKHEESAKANEGAYATLAASKIIRGCIPLVSKAISSWLEANSRLCGKGSGRGGGRPHTAYSTLNRFDPDALAYLSLQGVFQGVTFDYTLSKILTSLGQSLEAEVIAKELEDQRGLKTAKRIKEMVSKQGSARNRSKVFKKLTKDQEVSHEPWDQVLKVRMAEPLVNAVLESLSELFVKETVANGLRDKAVFIRLTEEGCKLMSELQESAAWMHPLHKPMVVKPRPWTSFDTGCYYDERAAHNVRLVRTVNPEHRKMVKEALKCGQMDYVLEAVNSIQEVPWSINKEVLRVLQWAWVNNLSIGKMPLRKLIDVQRLEPEVFEKLSASERKGYRIKLRDIREKNRGITADIKVMIGDLDTAQELSKYERFYLPHNLDFRGRVYPICHFSHQRADHIKALFQFADGKVLGTHGADWLGVHLANCGDFNKVSKRSFDERLAWVAANEPLILRIAGDPIGTVSGVPGDSGETTLRSSGWASADKPFSFLAACMDYAGWVHSDRADTYVSRLPIALDGSNSGLQHYSAALRSRNEAALVSLTPSDRPADLYQTIADAVKLEVEREAAEGSLIADICLKQGITRKLVKRNVMTFAYSSEQYGFGEQIREDTMRPLSDDMLTSKANAHPYAMFRLDSDTKEETDELDEGFRASVYLADKVWRAVTSTVTKATEGMEFFKKVAGLLASEDKPLAWVTPVGLPALHKYSKWDTKTVTVWMYDRSVPVIEALSKDRITDDGEGVLKRVEANIRVAPTTKIDKEKARSAVAPNVIHSMDGAHLMLTVLAAKGVRITDVCLIHDSFATHAGKTDAFFQIIREAFVEMYEGYCPFEEVLEYARGVLSPEGIAKLPPVPTKGDFELREVLEAPYAFA